MFTYEEMSVEDLKILEDLKKISQSKDDLNNKESFDKLLADTRSNITNTLFEDLARLSDVLRSEVDSEAIKNYVKKVRKIYSNISITDQEQIKGFIENPSIQLFIDSKDYLKELEDFDQKQTLLELYPPIEDYQFRYFKNKLAGSMSDDDFDEFKSYLEKAVANPKLAEFIDENFVVSLKEKQQSLNEEGRNNLSLAEVITYIDKGGAFWNADQKNLEKILEIMWASEKVAKDEKKENEYSIDEKVVLKRIEEQLDPLVTSGLPDESKLREFSESSLGEFLFDKKENFSSDFKDKINFLVFCKELLLQEETNRENIWKKYLSFLKEEETNENTYITNNLLVVIEGNGLEEKLNSLKKSEKNNEIKKMIEKIITHFTETEPEADEETEEPTPGNLDEDSTSPTGTETSTGEGTSRETPTGEGEPTSLSPTREESKFDKSIQESIEQLKFNMGELESVSEDNKLRALKPYINSFIESFGKKYLETSPDKDKDREADSIVDECRKILKSLSDEEKTLLQKSNFFAELYKEFFNEDGEDKAPNRDRILYITELAYADKGFSYRPTSLGSVAKPSWRRVFTKKLETEVPRIWKKVAPKIRGGLKTVSSKALDGVKSVNEKFPETRFAKGMDRFYGINNEATVSVATSSKDSQESEKLKIWRENLYDELSNNTSESLLRGILLSLSVENVSEAQRKIVEELKKVGDIRNKKSLDEMKVSIENILKNSSNSQSSLGDTNEKQILEESKDATQDTRANLDSENVLKKTSKESPLFHKISTFLKKWTGFSLLEKGWTWFTNPKPKSRMARIVAHTAAAGAVAAVANDAVKNPDMYLSAGSRVPITPVYYDGKDWNSGRKAEDSRNSEIKGRVHDKLFEKKSPLSKNIEELTSPPTSIEYDATSGIVAKFAGADDITLYPSNDLKWNMTTNRGKRVVDMMITEIKRQLDSGNFFYKFEREEIKKVLNEEGEIHETKQGNIVFVETKELEKWRKGESVDATVLVNKENFGKRDGRDLLKTLQALKSAQANN